MTPRPDQIDVGVNAAIGAGLVVIDFGRPIQTIAITPENARLWARLLAHKAEQAQRPGARRTWRRRLANGLMDLAARLAGTGREAEGRP